MRLVVDKKDELIYGPVLITKGSHKGKVGYYDDEDEDDNLIIYPDMPIHCTDCYTVNRTAATSVIPTKRLAERWSEIDEELHKNHAIRHLLPKKEAALLYERILCSDLLTERYLNSMKKLQDQEKIEIFISHSSKDIVFSRAIATDLVNCKSNFQFA